MYIGTGQTTWRKLGIWLALYSQIPTAIQNGTESNVVLHPSSEDSCRLFTDVSFQLSGDHHTALLPQLGLSEEECYRIREDSLQDTTEQFYRMLLTWAAQPQQKSLKDLLSLLASVGIAGIDVISDCDCDGQAGQPFISLNCEHSTASMDGQPACKLFCNLARKVVKLRWFLARFLGVAECEIDCVKESYTNNPREQSFQLLRTWQREKSDDATCGVLAKTIYWLYKLDARMFCDAWGCVRVCLSCEVSSECQLVHTLDNL